MEWEMEWEWNRNIHENWLSKWYDWLKIWNCRYLFCRMAIFCIFCDISTTIGMEWEMKWKWNGNGTGT